MDFEGFFRLLTLALASLVMGYGTWCLLFNAHAEAAAMFSLAAVVMITESGFD